jgi:hypothetical protein
MYLVTLLARSLHTEFFSLIAFRIAVDEMSIGVISVKKIFPNGAS